MKPHNFAYMQIWKISFILIFLHYLAMHTYNYQYISSWASCGILTFQAIFVSIPVIFLFFVYNWS